MEQKQFKVRIEDAKNGTVEEFETNCLSVVTVDEEDDEAYRSEVNTYQNCTNGCRIALFKALKQHVKKIDGELVQDFSAFLREEPQTKGEDA